MFRFCLLVLLSCFMLCSCVMHISTKGEIMANTEKPVELSSLERQWVRKSIDLQMKSLKRSLANEIQGSEIYALRQREISDLNSILLKF